jgi:GxxExxY protein
MSKIIYPELSYEIIGAAFKVFNNLEYGHNEKYYQRALEEEFKIKKINFEKEKEVDLLYLDKKIGKYRLDFILENKIVVELKVLSDFRQRHIKQVMGYLKETKLKLAIIIYFTKAGVKYRRVVNSY